MIKNPILKNTLSALAILVSIPILLTLLFLFYALIFNFYDKIIPWAKWGRTLILFSDQLRFL